MTVRINFFQFNFWLLNVCWGFQKHTAEYSKKLFPPPPYILQQGYSFCLILVETHRKGTSLCGVTSTHNISHIDDQRSKSKACQDPFSATNSVHTSSMHVASSHCVDVLACTHTCYSCLASLTFSPPTFTLPISLQTSKATSFFNVSQQLKLYTMKASAPSYDYESVLPSNSTRLRKSTELREKETKGSKYARARVMLKHGEDRVNLEGKQWFFMRQQTPSFS